MSYFNIVCDSCGRGVQSIAWVSGMKFCAKCYQETFGASKDWQLLDKDKTITEQRQRIADLEEQLAEKEERIAELEDKDWYEATIKQLEEANGRLIKQRDDAKLQLVKKEQELLEVKHRVAEKASKEFQEMIDKRGNHNQDKISFCIERLEKVKEEAKHYGYDFSKSMHEFVDNQIEELKKLEELKGDNLNGEN